MAYCIIYLVSDRPHSNLMEALGYYQNFPNISLGFLEYTLIYSIATVLERKTGKFILIRKSDIEEFILGTGVY